MIFLITPTQIFAISVGMLILFIALVLMLKAWVPPRRKRSTSSAPNETNSDESSRNDSMEMRALATNEEKETPNGDS